MLSCNWKYRGQLNICDFELLCTKFRVSFAATFFHPDWIKAGEPGYEARDGSNHKVFYIACVVVRLGKQHSIMHLMLLSQGLTTTIWIATCTCIHRIKCLLDIALIAISYRTGEAWKQGRSAVNKQIQPRNVNSYIEGLNPIYSRFTSYLRQTRDKDHQIEDFYSIAKKLTMEGVLKETVLCD